MRPPNLELVKALAQVSEEAYGPNRNLYNALKGFLNNSPTDKLLQQIKQLMDLNYRTETVLLMAEVIVYVEKWMRNLKKELPLKEPSFLEEISQEALVLLNKNRMNLSAYPLIIRLLELQLQEMLKDPKVAPELRRLEEEEEEAIQQYLEIEERDGVEAAMAWHAEQLDARPNKGESVYPPYKKELGPPLSNEEWEGIFKKA